MSHAFRLIDNELGRVKELISSTLYRDAPAVIYDAIYPLRDTIFSGKMLRPGLVLLCGAAVDKITDRHIHVATAIEMIHNATLLHDDVIDEGQKRRGAPTINSLQGNEFAILLGDFLLSKVFEMCSDFEPQIIKILAATTARTCEGEFRQLIQRQDFQLSESEYIDIIAEKSAALFSSCCQLGAILACADQAQEHCLSFFGRNVGIAFQITDDLLDIIGDENKMGKTLGSDVDKNKLTLAVIHLLGAVDEQERSLLKDRLTAASENKQALVEMLKSHGSLEYAHSRAREFVAKAVQSLVGLKESRARDALIETARFVSDRVTIP